MSDVITKTVIYVDGIGLPLPQSFNWSHPPGPVDEMVTNIQDEFERPIRIQNNYAAGEFEVIAYSNATANDPLPLMDILGFNDTYAYFDTSTETVIHSTTTYDWTEEQSGMLGMPQIPIELRQTEAGVTQAISTAGGGAKDMIAFRFKAAGEDIHRLVILCEDVTGSEVTSVELQVWTDVANEPGALISSTNTPNIAVTVPSDTEDYLELTNLEEDAANDLLDGEELTVGNWYWMVIHADDADTLTLHGTTNQRYTGSDVMVSDDAGSTWTAAGNSMENLVFTLQFYHKYGGHTVEVREYTADKTKYVKNLCQASEVRITGPTYATQKATRVSFKFKSNNAVATKVTS